MEGMIDKDGELRIRRGGRWRDMICPYKQTRCSDECPLLGEPQRLSGGTAIVPISCGQSVGAIWVFDDFFDERAK